MKVGIVHGAGINPDGSLQPHTEARANAAIEAYNNSTVEWLIVCGKDEAYPIISYMLSKGIGREKIIAEPFSWSTLSNLYYCKIILSSLITQKKPIDKVCLISSYWHNRRLSYDAGRILGEYKIEFIAADDPRSEEEIKKDKKLEKFKFISDMVLLNLRYGRKFYKEQFLASTQREMLESIIERATPPYQRGLMKLEKLLYKAMKLL